MTRTRIYAWAAVAAVAGSTPVWAAEADVLRDAVDPYNLARERGRFIAAAGADSELGQSEFESNAAAEGGFIRAYDKWDAIKAFGSADGGKIGWSEAQEYRRALRKAVLAQYDTNGDGKLEGEEREAANKDLAAGKAPKIDRPAVAVAPAPAPAAANSDRRRGFGREVSPEQLAQGEARRQEWNQRLITQYDRDGDGKLSDTEREAMEPRARMFVRFQDLTLPHFDEDGDGQLNPAEQQSILALGQKLRGIGEEWRVGVADLNKDGIVTPEEERQIQQRIQQAGMMVAPKLVAWNDANNDGRVDEQERRAVFRNVAQTAEKKIQDWTEQFDSDGDARLNEAERDAMTQGVRQQYEKLYTSHDANSDGQLDVNETAAFLEALATEWGAKPPRFQ